MIRHKTAGVSDEPRREDRDESTVRVDEESLEMSLEMSQQRELATGARGSDARSCYDSAGETPPIPLTCRLAKCGICRVVPADHEVPDEHMQRRLQESEVADERRGTAERGNGLISQGPPPARSHVARHQ